MRNRRSFLRTSAMGGCGIITAPVDQLVAAATGGVKTPLQSLEFKDHGPAVCYRRTPGATLFHPPHRALRSIKASKLPSFGTSP